MTQIAVRLPDPLVEKLDRLVAEGTFPSRSEVVRSGIQLVLEAARRRAVDAGYAAGYGRMPETAQELADARRSALDAIEDEPWTPWW